MKWWWVIWDYLLAWRDALSGRKPDDVAHEIQKGVDPRPEGNQDVSEEVTS